jgi:hypothetical protein
MDSSESFQLIFFILNITFLIRLIFHLIKFMFSLPFNIRIKKEMNNINTFIKYFSNMLSIINNFQKMVKLHLNLQSLKQKNYAFNVHDMFLVNSLLIINYHLKLKQTNIISCIFPSCAHLC